MLKDKFSVPVIAMAMCLASASSSGAPPAPAPTASAKLISLRGSVMVNQGEAFVQAKNGIPLFPGDRVLVLEGGEAMLKFAAGCTMNVDPGQVITLPVQSPCNGESGLVQADALGGPIGGAEQASPWWINYALGFGTAGAAAAIVLSTDEGGNDDDDEDTVSP